MSSLATVTVRNAFAAETGTYRAQVDTDGTVRVWGSVAGHYTRCHSLTPPPHRPRPPRGGLASPAHRARRGRVGRVVLRLLRRAARPQRPGRVVRSGPPARLRRGCR